MCVCVCVLNACTCGETKFIVGWRSLQGFVNVTVSSRLLMKRTLQLNELISLMSSCDKEKSNVFRFYWILEGVALRPSACATCSAM